jgi:dephospho-CoA kinase
MIYRVGLTGGIGSGKSTVAAMFHDWGVPILDADEIAREIVEPGSDALAEILASFGSAIGTKSGLDRATLRDRVFRNPEDRKRLEAIIHPRVRQAIADRLPGIAGPYCIVVIPLLIEAGFQDAVDRILVVDVDAATQRARLRTRQGWTDATIDGVLAAQVGRKDRLQAADDVITNNGSLDSLRQQVETLHQRYLGLAAG